MHSARAAGGALLALASWGCSDDPQLVIVIEHPTLIEVSPAEFLGSVPCLPAKGAMRRYVATVFDVTPAADAGTAENFALPSSGPVPCTAPIGTAFVVHGRRYAAEVDSYDREDLESLAAGSRVMVDRKSGEAVLPRWTTSCGRGEGESIMAVYQVTRRVAHCDPLTDQNPTEAEPEVVVTLEDALGELACGPEAGQVARFEVRDPESGSRAETTCEGSATLSGLMAGTVLELELLAFEAGQTSPSWGTLCSATPAPGVTVEAVCQSLASRGALDIDLPDALGAVSLACDQSLRELVADPAGESPPKRVTPPGCTNALRLSDLPAGETTVSLTTTLSDGSAGPSLTCGGTVLPGLAARAECVAD